MCARRTGCFCAMAARVVTGSELDEMECYVDSEECMQYVDQTTFGPAIAVAGGEAACSWGAEGKTHPARFARRAAMHATVSVCGQGDDEDCRVFATDTHAEPGRAPEYGERKRRRASEGGAVAAGAPRRTGAHGRAAARRTYLKPGGVDEYLDLLGKWGQGMFQMYIINVAQRTVTLPEGRFRWQLFALLALPNDGAGSANRSVFRNDVHHWMLVERMRAEDDVQSGEESGWLYRCRCNAGSSIFHGSPRGLAAHRCCTHAHAVDVARDRCKLPACECCSHNRCCGGQVHTRLRDAKQLKTRSR